MGAGFGPEILLFCPLVSQLYLPTYLDRLYVAETAFDFDRGETRLGG